MITTTKVLSLPQSISALTNSIVTIAQNSLTLEEALLNIAKYVNTLRPNLMSVVGMDAARAKAYEVSKMRSANIPFELRWRGGGGEIVKGWESLALALKELDLRYKVSTLKTQLSAKKTMSIDLVNPNTGLLDVFSVRRLYPAKASLGRPIGSKNKAPRQTRAARVQTLINPSGNKLKRVYDDLA